MQSVKLQLYSDVDLPVTVSLKCLPVLQGERIPSSKGSGTTWKTIGHSHGLSFAFDPVK